MAELTVESGPSRGQSLEFSEAETLLIGSAEECTFRLQVPGVAERHLVIKALKNGGFGVKRLDGSFLLNGQGTEAARLSDGDVLEIGSTRLRFGPPQENGRMEGVPEIEGYRLIEVLGKGGHGTVYRAEQLSLHREVALKILNKEKTANPEFVGRFVAEARAAARLSHPNVVQVFDVGHDGDTYYLSMEIMEHGSLEDRLKREKRLPVEDCLNLMIDAARGLSYAESMRIVHRDIKPDNLMVDSHGVAKIADLGLAMSDEEEQGKIVGTPHFMSPEQVLNRTIDHRSDLYSLGCTFFRLVTGRTLFPKKTTKEILTAHVKSEPDSADEVHDGVPVGVAEIIDQLVEKDPDDRYQSADELVDDLKTVLHPPQKKGLLIGIVTILVLGAGFAIYWGVTRPEGKGGTKIVKVKDPELEKRLRETTALARYNELINRNAEPLAKATSLETFAKQADYSGTKAAADAIARAKDLRSKEAARVKAASERDAMILAARDKLRSRLEKWIDTGKWQEAVAGFRPTDIPKDTLKDDTLQLVLSEMRQKLRDAGTAKLNALRAAVTKAKTDRDAVALEQAIAAIDAVVDKESENAWPREAFEDRQAILTYTLDERRGLKQLRTDLESSRESSARANFRRRTLAKDGILDLVSRFDLDAAEALATTTHSELKGFAAEPKAKGLLDLVTAAKAYHKALQAAIAAGTVRVPVSVDGAITEVKVRSFATSGTTPGLTVELPNGSASDTKTIALADLRGARLLDLMVDVGTGTDTASAHRLAFLGLHALRQDLRAASSYMAKIDPEVESKDRVEAGTAELNRILEALTKVSPPWRDFLSSELRATRELMRGLRAFSLQRYTSSQSYLESLQKRFKGSFAVLQTR